MAKDEKLGDRFSRTPTPKDFQWDDLVRLLRGLGFTVKNKKGSRCRFTARIEGIERQITLPEPHPSGTIKPYVIREVKERLKEWNLR